MKRRTLLQKLENNQVKATLYVAKIDSLPGKVNNTYHGKGKMNKYFRFAVRDDQNEVLEFLVPEDFNLFAVRDDQNEVLEFLVPEDFNLSGLLLSLPGEQLELIFDVHMDEETPTYELVRFENLTQTLESINDEIKELMDAGDLWFYKKKEKSLSFNTQAFFNKKLLIIWQEVFEIKK